MIREGRLWLIQTLVIPTFSTKSMLSKELLLDGVISESFTKTMVIGEVSKFKKKIRCTQELLLALGDKFRHGLKEANSLGGEIQVRGTSGFCSWSFSRINRCFRSSHAVSHLRANR